MDGRTDQALWDASVAGDADAFGELFTRHHEAVYTYCFRRVSSWASAEDLMSTTFLETWRTRRPMTLDTGSLRPWLIGVATRVAHRHHRSVARQVGLAARVAGTTVSATQDPSDDIAARLDDERAMAEVLSVVATLPQREQDVLAVCVFAGLDYASAAAALGIPVGTVRSRLSRARQRLSKAAPHLQLLVTQHG
ncbi:MAG: RNA polymerase sigma factor [Dermatophilaceae bacterium]